MFLPSSVFRSTFILMIQKLCIRTIMKETNELISSAYRYLLCFDCKINVEWIWFCFSAVPTYFFIFINLSRFSPILALNLLIYMTFSCHPSLNIHIQSRTHWLWFNLKGCVKNLALFDVHPLLLSGNVSPRVLIDVSLLLARLSFIWIDIIFHSFLC